MTGEVVEGCFNRLLSAQVSVLLSESGKSELSVCNVKTFPANIVHRRANRAVETLTSQTPPHECSTSGAIKIARV